jgi:hypothetical protein
MVRERSEEGKELGGGLLRARRGAGGAMQVTSCTSKKWNVLYFGHQGPIGLRKNNNIIRWQQLKE